ncbi:protoporphyrinogen oxidase [Leifsonia xyli subsp. xyli str. CTCB07]|uniref:Coproporphyrinogen III oxidase n=2 Tax=Leifsonia xyli subsp. xyli TaxID=59736 RepID=Q6AHF4_LEIXX|nr:protoporphyrinogen oxidase [Leifsonia xyli subsp. xyli str. CTCB07]
MTSLGAELRQTIEADPTRIAVVGGGMAGLVAARECARPGFEVIVLEAADRIGGSVAPLELDGMTLDAGAESFATRGGHVAELLDELGLAGDVVSPNPAGAWVRTGTKSVPLPKAGLLGIPSSPLASDVVAAIGWGGALRAYLDRLLPVLKIGQERRLGTLVRKRMGAKALHELVAPVVTGVYSAAPDDLDIEVVAPGLNAALTRLGSLSGAVGELWSQAKAGSAVQGLRGGMWRLPAALAADFRARGGSVRTAAAVTAIEPWAASETHAPAGVAHPESDGGRRPARWTLRLADGTAIDTDAVVMAAPAHAALALLPTASPSLAGLAGLDWPPASSVELVTLVLTTPAAAEAPRGTGVLVADAPGSGVTAKALTHASAKWAWVAEAAGDGCHVVRLSYGRAGQPGTRELGDQRLREIALADASALLNIPLAVSDVAAFARILWTNALPYATVGQRERIQRVRDGVGSVEGLEVTGSWLTGTGLASVVPDARQAAERARGSTLESTDRGHGGVRMRGKILFVAGAAVGYVLGARAGRKRYDQLKAAAARVWESPSVQKRVHAVEDFMAEKACEAPEAVFVAIKKAVVRVNERRREARSPIPEPETAGDGSAS